MIYYSNYFVGSVTDVPEYDFEEQRDSFSFNSLWTRIEAIVASAKVSTIYNQFIKMMCNDFQYIQKGENLFYTIRKSY